MPWGGASTRMADRLEALTRAGRLSSLKRWALAVAGRRGMKRAKVALARKLASVLHRMWLDGTGFRFGKEVAAA